MLRVIQSLSAKIVGMLLVFFLVALTAIGLTLSISWQLEGAAATINDAGSLRMRVYRIAHHLARADAEMRDPVVFAERLQYHLDGFETVLRQLGSVDPKRPLLVPRDDDIPADIRRLSEAWQDTIRPMLAELISNPDPDLLRARIASFDATASGFVAGIHDVVVKMEHSYAHNTNILRVSQVLLIVLAVIGTLVLIRFFFVLVIRPVTELSEGMRRMGQEDFAVRVPVLDQGEFGELSQGFNQMAAHLQELYATLEQRVEDKTRSLTETNRELQVLYTIGGVLHEQGDIDRLCHAFLQRVRAHFEATASSVRLLDSGGKHLCITVCEGLDPSFMDDEAALACHECLCGAALQGNATCFADPASADATMTLDTCLRAGFRAVSATTVTVNKRPIGVFNLYFDEPRALGESDRRLLETLGQQLGAAIDALRLQARDRELAVFEERNLLARELHDSIAQGLAFLNLQVQMLEDALARNASAEMRDILRMIRQGVQESYDDVRELLVHFRTRVRQEDLDAAIEAALRRLAEQTGISTDFELQGGGAPLDPETETQVLYIVQEALSNVRKHAGARSVTVRLRRGLEGLAVSIRDDGEGFDATQASQADVEDHIGLQVMRERALRIGAQFSVRASRGKGTEIRLELPRKHEETA